MNRNSTYNETEQAAYLARHFLEEIALGIEVSIWYKDMNGESGFSLYEAGPGSRLRLMGHTLRNLAALFDTNPKQMINHTYQVKLLTTEKSKLESPIPLSFKDEIAWTPELKIGPVPTILVVDLKP
jgi:hypothetical protein